MRRSRRSADTTAPDAALDARPESQAGESAFDAAQNLLNAVLDEVQTPTAGADQVDGKTPDLMGAGSNGPRRLPQGESSVHGRSPVGAHTPADGTGTGTSSETETDLPRRRRRPRRRPIPRSPDVSGDELPVPVASRDESEAPSIATLDGEPQTGHRRWRRLRAEAALATSIEAPGVERDGNHRRWRRTAVETNLPMLSGDIPAVADDNALAPAAEALGEETLSLDSDALLASAPEDPPEVLPEPFYWLGVTPASALEPALSQPTADGGHTRSRRRGVLLVAATLAVVVAVVVTLFATAFSGGESGRRAQSPTHGATPAVRLAFDPVTTPEGIQVHREWTLRGEKGTDFVGRLSFSNPTPSTIVVSHTEVIPKSLASSVNEIDFRPQPTIVQPDPVVRYSVTVPPGGEVTVRYDIGVPADGAEQARLDTWAQDMRDASQAIADSATTTTVPPTTTTTSAPPPTTTKPPTATTTAPSPDTTPPPTPSTSSPPPATGTIVIRTISYGGTGTFGFSGPGGNVSLTTSGAPDGLAESAAMTVAAGKYAWTETSLSDGWGLFGIDCTDRDAGPFEERSTVSGATATFNVQPGETVVCTWSNR